MVLREDFKKIIRTASMLCSDALFLYDRTNYEVLQIEPRSSALEHMFKNQDLLEMIQTNNHFSLVEVSLANCWRLVKDPTQGKLSLNVCLDRNRLFFVNLQMVVLDIESSAPTPKYLLCSLEFSTREDEDIVFVDRDNEKLWMYDFKRKDFRLLDDIPLTYYELEIIRLSRMGYTEKKIASILYKSLDTIRWYKKKIYRKLGVNNLQTCISFCEAYHII